MLPINKQLSRDFAWILKQKETPTITIAYDTIENATQVKFYGNTTGTVTPHTLNVKSIVEIVDEWKVKSLPYADLHIGQAIFYINKSVDLSAATNIKVTYGGHSYLIKLVDNAVPFGADYLCKVLISAE